MTLFAILTLFPDAVEPYLGASILGIAQEKGLARYQCVDFRDFARDRHRTVDDRPFGVIAGQAEEYDAKCVPAVIFTSPEMASVGMTEAQAAEQGIEVKSGSFPFAASGRAMSLMETDGFVKVVADAKTDELLGVHMVGPEVTELIAEAALAIELGATAEDMARTIHAHPTLPEAMMEAAEAVHGAAVHIFQAK